MTAETGGSLTEAEGVAVVGTEDAKPVPEAASNEAWAASWLELAGREESPWELATLAGTLQARRLATCWAESTCWTALAMAARKAGDVGETTDLEDRAVEAKILMVLTTIPEEFPWTPAQETRHLTLPTGYYECFWCSSYFWCQDPQRSCENLQRFANREQLIHKDL